VNLALSRIHFPVTALGPGNRVGIWFQGCSIRCAGCISVDTWAPGKTHVTLEDVIATVSPWLEQATGLTISGGEPFDQPGALHGLLCEIRKRFTTVDILVFTGYEIAALPDFVHSEQLIDALITDPYRSDLPQTLALRGSDNQALHLLTDLGRHRLGPFARQRNTTDDRLDLMVDDDGTVWMAGIPKRGDLGRLLALLRANGHHAHGSQDIRKEPS
jgi:anaerobic ribonucleoside-triphosphate reductase activating protein